jgi:hypothetical protein
MFYLSFSDWMVLVIDLLEFASLERVWHYMAVIFPNSITVAHEIDLMASPFPIVRNFSINFLSH